MLNPNSLSQELQYLDPPLKYGKIRRILDDMYQNNILRNESEIDDPILENSRTQTDVEGRYNPYKLGMTRQNVIFFDVEDEESTQSFADVCDAHPYTHYRSHTIGEGLHLYAQFDIPITAKSLMAEFYDKFAALLACDHHEIFTPEHVSNSADQLDLWSSKQGWQFSVFDGDDSLEEQWDRAKVPRDRYLVSQWVSELENLDELDMLLLRELSINGKIGPKELSQYYDRDQSTLSRRLKFLREHVLGNHILFYNRRLFDITTPLLILGETEHAYEINKLHHLVDKNSIPFRSFLASEKNHYLSILWSPPSYASDLAYFFWKHSVEFRSSNFRISHDSTWSYPFYNLNFEPETKSWKQSRKYLIDEPIEGATK